jgi:hypothetical protein
MAIKRFKIDGFGQIELNQVAFRREGRIEAQCALDGTDFANIPAENGMLLAVDTASRTVKLPEDGANLPIALNYTTEHMYDDRKNGLKDFKLEIADGFYPRLSYLTAGDKFTTNCLSYDDGEFSNDEAVETAYENGTELFGGVCENGTILVSKTAPVEGPVLRAAKGMGAGSLADGQFGMKFHVVKA